MYDIRPFGVQSLQRFRCIVSADPLHDSYQRLQRCCARAAAAKHAMLQTEKCLDDTRRAIETSLAQLDRRIPSLLRTRGSRPFHPIYNIH
jgi:hypothetical protein